VTTTTVGQVHLEVLLRPDDLRRRLRQDAKIGLAATPKTMPPTWLYDERGCELFDDITRLPEYYPTRRETALLASHAAEIAQSTGADTLVELGSGTCEKTPTLLDALTAGSRLTRFVPFDVAEGTTREAACRLVARYSGLSVHGIVGDFREQLWALPDGGRRMVAFLGGTFGNLQPSDRAAFLGVLVGVMAAGDTLLIGCDLVKDRRRLIAAYDDATGVTAAFNRNLLTRLNRELGANFDPSAFAHVALFDEANSWIEMRLRARCRQRVQVVGLDLDVDFDTGEYLRSEISTKFVPDAFRSELGGAGLHELAWWTDPAGDYALSLWGRS
jgi:L-histidine Nalpha-methyltransferase